jgi:hypothetical protein
MRRSLLAVVALAFAGLAAGCVVEGDSTLTIRNDSSFVLTEVHLADVSDPSWGPNLLPDVLFPGESLTIGGIDCGTYDVMVVDETGVDCELSSFDLCFDDGVWVVGDAMLDSCAF